MKQSGTRSSKTAVSSTIDLQKRYQGVRMKKQKGLGPALKVFREIQGIKQREISRAMGYSSPQIISNFERGICELPIQQMFVYARECKIPEELMLGSIIANRIVLLIKEMEDSKPNKKPLRRRG